MNISELSIRRPVLATVLTIIILLFGFIGYSYLGVREYPSVDNPIISVSCSYPGANADVIENQITEPLEQNINGIPGIRSLSSVSQQGQSRITVEFELSVDLETAANDVRDKVSRAQRYLPRDCDPPTVSKADADAMPILMVALQSDKRSLLELSEIADLTVKEQLQTISDVSSVSIWGEKRYSMRLWLDPVKMAGYGITPIDVKNAVDNENVELPSGSIEGNTTELTIRTLGLMHTADEFNNLIVKEDNDLDGNADDWWYNETLPLNSTEWKKAKIDIRTFQAFDWHPNTSKKCDALRVISLDFVVPSSAPCSGGVLALDDIAMTGLINPAPDFEATTIVRRNDRFAADETDGEVVYDGEGECYTDSELEKATYYYAAFSHDDLKNYSAFTEAATWKYTVTTGVDGNKRVDFTVAPNPVREYVTVIFPGDSVSELSVINSQGEIVMREKLKESVTSLPVEGLSPGIYLVSVKSSGQIYNRKIIVE